jgi:uncharacterized repeat protein (TIGR03803 family)
MKRPPRTPSNLPDIVQTAFRHIFRALLATLVLVSSTQAANKYRVMHEFFDRPASAPYAALVADSAGNLYGTASSSNSNGCGTTGCGAVFKLTRESGGKWSYSIIYRFKGPDGSFPVASLVFDSSGNLYGTTFYGGAHGNGTVFELSPSGNEWKEKVLSSFGDSPNDLSRPGSSLTLDARGLGGPDSQGGVFELRRFGKQWKRTAIHVFTGGPDGGKPCGTSLVRDSAGNLYGTTAIGGQFGWGVALELTPSSGGDWTETVLYNFTGGNDGGNPASGMIFDLAGNLYGTTSYGGLRSCNQDGSSGTVFQLTSSMGEWILTTLHAFDNSDGALPPGGLTLDSAGSLYGTTGHGGASDLGVAFKLSQSGGRWTESVLHSFNENGARPRGGLVLDQQGVVYGTTLEGGVLGYGVVFTITQ